jgi:hypothetical protein
MISIDTSNPGINFNKHLKHIVMNFASKWPQVIASALIVGLVVYLFAL